MSTPTLVALQPKALKGRKVIEIRIGGGIGIGGGRKTRRIDEDLSRGPGRETGIKTARGGTLTDEAGLGIEIEIGGEVEAEIGIAIEAADAVGVGVEAEIGIETRIACRQKMA